jgi:hypothetical protein
MNIELSRFFDLHQSGESAKRPLARPDGRLALSLLLAGMSLPRRRFAQPAAQTHHRALPTEVSRIKGEHFGIRVVEKTRRQDNAGRCAELPISTEW